MKYIVFFLLSSVFGFSQSSKVDFKSVHGQIEILPEQRAIQGLVTYKYTILKPVDTLKLDAVRMQFDNVKINGKPAKYIRSEKQLLIVGKFKKKYSLFRRI